MTEHEDNRGGENSSQTKYKKHSKITLEWKYHCGKSTELLRAKRSTYNLESWPLRLLHYYNITVFNNVYMFSSLCF